MGDIGDRGGHVVPPKHLSGHSPRHKQSERPADASRVQIPESSKVVLRAACPLVPALAHMSKLFPAR